MEELLQVGVITSTHGVRGEVKVFPTTDDPNQMCIRDRGMVAKRHTRRNVITASVDSLSFLRGAYVKDTVVIIGKVTYVGNTSMEVKVDTYVEALSGERTPINHAYFTMVALDKNDKPVRAPRLELETEEEKEEWEKGEKRRELRMMRKEEGL